MGTGAQEGTLTVDGRVRSYLSYVPRRRQARPALVLLLHASRQSAQDLRRATGYSFDRLADRHGFIAVYPESYGKRWNDCRAAGRYKARRLGLDDVHFLLALVERFQADADIDPTRVFVAGYSSGGQLAFRLALERPERVTAIAAFAANLPSDENWACRASGKPVPALLVHGTEDRISPFAGGRVAVFGFASRGSVRSSLDSAQYFARLAGSRAFTQRRLAQEGETWVEEFRWYEPGAPEVALLAVHGGGHVVPSPNAAFPRILGRVSSAIDGARESWEFFARQRPLAPR